MSDTLDLFLGQPNYLIICRQFFVLMGHRLNRKSFPWEAADVGEHRTTALNMSHVEFKANVELV